MKVVMAISLAVTFAVFANCLAKDDYSILQDLHRNIGKDLIIVRKEHAGAQAIIYSVLDQVGQLYTFSKNILEKKEKYRQLLRRAKDHVGSFKNNVTRVEKRAAEYKKRANDVEQRLRESETLVAKLANERNTIEKEQENLKVVTSEVDQEKQELVQERDSLIRERDALIRERDAVLRERDSLLGESDRKFVRRKIAPRV
jgi:peptidoglycan hydrolase CwlO-like protein